METYSITLPDDVSEIVKEKAAESGFTSPTDFLQAFITNTLDRQARDRLEAMLLEGVESGPPIEATEEFWKQKKERLVREYHERTGK